MCGPRDEPDGQLALGGAAAVPHVSDGAGEDGVDVFLVEGVGGGGAAALSLLAEEIVGA